MASVIRAFNFPPSAVGFYEWYKFEYAERHIQRAWVTIDHKLVYAKKGSPFVFPKPLGSQWPRYFFSFFMGRSLGQKKKNNPFLFNQPRTSVFLYKLKNPRSYGQP